ncbi:MAG: serine/threonine-protein kinase [Dehalococcoidia bacterium]
MENDRTSKERDRATVQPEPEPGPEAGLETQAGSSALQRAKAQQDLGRLIGHYRLVARLGSGGFATVYRAEDTRLGRQIAIKLLHPHLALDDAFVQRFENEARASARLRHPHIVTIHGVGETEDGRPYLLMELLDGRSLSQIVAENVPIAMDRIVDIISQLASALDYLHAEGLVHRDLKPANVMIDGAGNATLMDFGIVRSLGEAETENPARLTDPGQTLGTPAYMAPEQLRTGTAGPASDIYALGTLTYELIAGRPPFTGTALTLILDQLESSPPPIRSMRPDISAPAVRAIEQALAKDPATRPATASAFAALLSDPAETWPSLRQAQDHQGVGAAGPPAGSQFRGRLLRYMGSSLLVVLFGLLAVVLVGHRRSVRNGGRPDEPLPAIVTIVAEDGGAQAQRTIARHELAQIVASIRQDYGLDLNRPLTIHLASNRMSASGVLKQALLYSDARANAALDLSSEFYWAPTESGLEVLVYPILTPSLPAVLAYNAGNDALFSVTGGKDPSGIYPYWFVAGFPRYELARKSTTSADYLHKVAASDAQEGRAASLSALTYLTDAQALSGNPSGNQSVTARTEAAVEYVAHVYGEKAIAQLLHGNGDGSIERFDQLLQTVTGLTVEQLDRALNSYLLQRQ